MYHDLNALNGMERLNLCWFFTLVDKLIHLKTSKKYNALQSSGQEQELLIFSCGQFARSPKQVLLDALVKLHIYD